MRAKQRRQVRVLLPDKHQLDFTVGVKARGLELLSRVLERLGVGELLIFSLAVLRDDEYFFLDLDQKLRKYFGKRWIRGSLMVPFILFLRVQCYVETGRLLLSGKVRQLYYTELRQKVLRSQSRQQEALFFQLAASALQAEVGDLDQSDEEEQEGEEGGERRRGRDHVFLPEDYFPSWLIKRRGREYLLRHGPALQAELRGLSRGRAILQFIKDAGRLQDGPLTFYRMRQQKKELKGSILLGVGLKGVQIYQELEWKQCLLYDLSWTDVDRFLFQGGRFEIHAVGSRCLPKLLYYTGSAFHSKHILKHLSDSHRLHISTREAVSYIQQLEDLQASQFYKEAYICDTARLRQRLHCNSLASSVSDCSLGVEANSAWTKAEEEEEEEEEWQGSVAEFEQCVDEPEEVFVDSPSEVSWLAELLYGVSVDGPSAFPPSCWAAVTMEMEQVLRSRADGGVPGN